MAGEEKEIHVVTRNRKARHEYEIVSTIEAGIELKGSEVKSVRAGGINLSDSYAVVEGTQVYLKNAHISPYELAVGEGHEPTRPRRLLLHKREIAKLAAKTQQQGLTLIPLSVYVKGKLIKIELALAMGRKKYDKRQAIAKAEASMRIRQAIKKNLDR
jgi:SsrA-binding protein